ncbi:MAG TPA: hypothetical protein VND19_13665 [Acetobacteraceae bacterium]|nr:hypothetical protein [Acetobacteraceae bacterium]
MAPHHDLLEQARHLAKREPTRPHPASLRRAVSASYYALFHFLVAKGARLIAPARPDGLRAQVGRAFVHTDMKALCRQFAGRTGSSDHVRPLLTQPLDPGLILIATRFLELQEERHAADYGMSQNFTRFAVLNMTDDVQRAFDNWAKIRSTPNTAVFLTALLLNRQWSHA